MCWSRIQSSNLSSRSVRDCPLMQEQNPALLKSPGRFEEILPGGPHFSCMFLVCMSQALQLWDSTLTLLLIKAWWDSLGLSLLNHEFLEDRDQATSIFVAHCRRLGDWHSWVMCSWMGVTIVKTARSLLFLSGSFTLVFEEVHLICVFTGTERVWT